MRARTLVVGSGQTFTAARAVPWLGVAPEDFYPGTSLLTLAFPPVAPEPGWDRDESSQNLVVRDARREVLDAVARPEHALVLVDFLEERFAVSGIRSGRAMTLSPTFRALESGSADNELHLRDPEHLVLWERGWHELVRRVRDAGRLANLYVHEAYFALEDEVGTPHPKAGWLAAQNEHLSKLYSIARASLPDGHVLHCSPEHRRHREGMPGDPITCSAAYNRDLHRLLQDAVLQGEAEGPLVDALRGVSLAAEGALAGHVWEGRAPHVAEMAGCPVRLNVPDSAVVKASDAELRVHVPVPAGVVLDGMVLRFRLSGFEGSPVVTAGRVEGSAIRGPRFAHVAQDEWLQEGWRWSDTIHRLHTGWQPAPDQDSRTLALRVLGTPGAGASLEIDWLTSFEHQEPAGLPPAWRDTGWLGDESVVDATVERLAAYVAQNNPYGRRQAVHYLNTGELPVFRDVDALPWGAFQEAAVEAEGLGTHRMLHHDLNLVASLLDLERVEGRAAGGAAARDLAQAWIEHNLVREPTDVEFAWYDHATAARTVALLLLWHAQTTGDVDARYRARLEAALMLHGRALASEAFYAHCQPLRHQNHSWFQDLALLALGLALSGGALGRQWMEIATRRLRQNMDELMVRDGQHVVWAENSSNYHAGAIALVSVTADLLRLAGHPPETDVTAMMTEWQALVRYPDGRTPSFGDVVPTPEPVTARPQTEPRSRVDLWPHAGYARVAGGSDSGFALFMTASSHNTVHKHEDNLAFSLWFDGVEWLGDPGLFNYDARDPKATYFRGHWAHSGISVEQRRYTAGPWLTSIWGEQGPQGFSIGGEHRCFDGLQVRRSLDGALDALAMRGCDEVVSLDDGDGSVVVAHSVFHLGVGVEVELSEHGAVLSHPSSFRRLAIRAKAEMHVVTGWNGTAEASSLSSTGLSQCTDTTTLLVRHSGGSPLEWEIEEVAPPPPGLQVTCEHEPDDLPTFQRRLEPGPHGEPWLPGLHVVDIGDEQHVDVMVRQDLREIPQGQPLVVFFNGAMSRREGTRPPYFSGNGVSNHLGIAWVAISDPTLHLDPDLLLGWYAASGQVQAAVVQVLQELARYSGHELLLVGGSGGGFAALHLASVIGGSCRALVWNPQTNILDYAPVFVEQYLRQVLPGLPRQLPPRAELETLLTARGITYEVQGLDQSAGVLILQNGRDWHVERHLQPLMEREGWREQGDARFVSPVGPGVAQVLEWGDGHAPLPVEGVREGIRLFAAGHSPREVAAGVATVLSSRARRVAIVGSCVTRDAFEMPQSEHFEVARYMARSALGSAMGPATSMLELDYGQLGSAFQRRTVRDDVEKSARTWLEETDFDQVVYDLVDERFAVLEFPDGGLVTESWEFQQLGADTSAASRHQFGSPRHTELWEEGWRALLSMLDERGMRSRLVVHAAPWVTAVRDSDQEPGPLGESIAANAWLAERLETIAADLRPEQVVQVDEAFWLADPDHRWGVTPFHYVPEYYADFLEKLRLT